MDILVIRHGQSEADLLDVHEGRADFELTEKGHKQAEAMAKFVSENFNINKIYSSTLKRAKQTALHLSKETGAEIEFDKNLMEFNNGLLAGLSHEEANKLYPEIKDLPVDKSVYGQETKIEFRERAKLALKKIIKENDDNVTIAIVSHGGMINQLYGVLFDVPVSKNSFICTGDTGIHYWRIKSNGNYVIQANINSHVKGI